MSAAGSTRAPQERESLGSLIGDVTADVSFLVRKEIELAKVETKDEAKKAGRGAGLLAGAGAAGLLALLFLSWALAWLLDDVMPRSLAFALVGVLYVAAAGVLFSVGKKALKHVDPVPRETVETLKEDKEWLQNRKS